MTLADLTRIALASIDARLPVLYMQYADGLCVPVYRDAPMFDHDVCHNTLAYAFQTSLRAGKRKRR